MLRSYLDRIAPFRCLAEMGLGETPCALGARLGFGVETKKCSGACKSNSLVANTRRQYFEQSRSFPALEIHLIGPERLAEKESLHIVTMLFTQEMQLPFVFNTLGSDGEMETPCHLNNRRSDRLFVAVSMQVVDEAAIDLELADWKLLEVAQARVAGAEVIDCELYAQCL